MACLIVTGPWGERLLPEGPDGNVRGKRKGETIVGVKPDCGVIQPRDIVDDEMEKAGVAWGDAIAWVTKRIGIKQCSPCKARQEILNSAGQLGFAETFRQIKDTFR